MTRRIEFNFSHVFEGKVWNTLASVKNNLLLVEVRNNDKKKVTFSAVEKERGEFLWRDVEFDEPWWISMAATSGDIILFTIYLETNNPDKKAIFAYHIFDRKVLWWNNDFSLISVSATHATGLATKYGMRTVTLDLTTGNEVDEATTPENDDEVIRPQQYLDDNAYFATVKTFLSRKFNLLPVIALEYLEYDSNIFISFYIQEPGLANYLFVLSAEGEVLLEQKLGDQLHGIGLDTFFVLSGCVVFVKDKVELFSYKFV